MKFSTVVYTTTVLLLSTMAFSQSHKNSKQNLNDLHKDNIGVETNMMFPATSGKVISLQILKNSQLKEHITSVPALLICVAGNATYEDGKGNKNNLLSGDFVKIEPNVKHWVNGIETTNLLLIK